MNKLMMSAGIALVAAAVPSIAAAQIGNITSAGQTIITYAQVVAYLVATVAFIVAAAKYAYTRDAHDAKGAGIVCGCALLIGLSVTIMNTIISATGSSSTTLNLPAH